MHGRQACVVTRFRRLSHLVIAVQLQQCHLRHEQRPIANQLISAQEFEQGVGKC